MLPSRLRSFSSSQRSRRVTLPSRKQGMSVVRPVYCSPCISHSVASRVSTPRRAAIGPVTKRLVAVMITSLSPASRCLASSSMALGCMIGSMQSRM
ncbi:hypothetical protein D3C77_733900 [compost metagenome]